MALNPLDGSNLEQLALKGLISLDCSTLTLTRRHFTSSRQHLSNGDLSNIEDYQICFSAILYSAVVPMTA